MTTESTTTAALIVAAGRGTRAGSEGLPKQYRQIGGRPVLAYCLDVYLEHPAIDSVQVIIGSDDARHYRALAPQNGKLRPPVVGGDTRQGSVLAGLAALASDRPDKVLIHDGARPFVSPSLIARVADALDRNDAIVPTLPMSSTVKAVEADGAVTATVARDKLHTAETPQGFRYATILAAHEKAAATEQVFTDDAAVAEWAGISVHSVAGDGANVKLTTAEDIAAADRRLLGEAALHLGDVRTGFGYDVHKLAPGSEVILGGLAIQHDHALVGHSDADVVLHALTDAILGALADGDIGAHFPPSDAQWRGVSSDRFLADAARRVAERGGIIAHLDVTIIAEAPKIGPHRDAMRQRVADICAIDVGAVAVKATTNEGLGFIGRREGIAANAVATIRLPFSRKP